MKQVGRTVIAMKRVLAAVVVCTCGWVQRYAWGVEGYVKIDVPGNQVGAGAFAFVWDRDAQAFWVEAKGPNAPHDWIEVKPYPWP
jgi:hypothetical protein